MSTITMTPTKLQERLAESGDRIDRDRFLQALWYVHDDGRRRPRRTRR